MGDRRDFLKHSTAFLGVLAAFGLLKSEAAAGSSASTQQNQKMLLQIINSAITKGDIKSVLSPYKAKLTPAQISALESITPQELRVLRMVRPKLRKLDLDIVSAPYIQ